MKVPVRRSPLLLLAAAASCAGGPDESSSSAEALLARYPGAAALRSASAAEPRVVGGGLELRADVAPPRRGRWARASGPLRARVMTADPRVLRLEAGGRRI